MARKGTPRTPPPQQRGRPVYRVEITKSAASDIRKLPRELQARIIAKADSLARDPRPQGVEKLKGQDDAYRVRVGDYRIIYAIEDDVLLVTVVKVGNRRDVYDNL